MQQLLAHLQGKMFNASALAQALGGASHTTAARYLGALVDTMMVRRLPPHQANLGKRLAKSPKVYVRDSGLLHTLLGFATVRSARESLASRSSSRQRLAEGQAGLLARLRA